MCLLLSPPLKPRSCLVVLSTAGVGLFRDASSGWLRSTVSIEKLKDDLDIRPTRSLFNETPVLYECRLIQSVVLNGLRPDAALDISTHRPMVLGPIIESVGGLAWYRILKFPSVDRVTFRSLYPDQEA